jgi:micrococcal nuclease
VMLGSDAALAYLRYQWSQGDDAATPTLGAMTLVYRRTASGWRVVHDHTSTLAYESAQSGVSELAPDFGPPAPVRATAACVVQRVVDGDTIDCGKLGRVRLLGMDAPEQNQPPFGARSTAALARLLRPGSVVNLEQDIEERDRYGRLLAYVWTENGMANWRMVRDGWAVVLTYSPNVQFVDAFITAQQQARDEKRGLWASGGFACLPVDHRRHRCE